MPDRDTARRLRVFLAYTAQEFALAYDPPALAQLERVADVVRNPGSQILIGPALAEAAAACDVIVGYRSTPCDAATFAALPHLRAFVRAAVDISPIDLEAASRLGILVARVEPGFANAVAELGMGLLVDLARGVTRHRLSAAGGVHAAPPQGRELSGATLGFIGYGRIARRMQQLASAFGMQTLAHDPLLTQADVPLQSLDAVLAASDFVVCLAAATVQTRHLMNEQRFARMKPGACFINLSRGELVDEEALERALDLGVLGGAALDVGSAPDQKPASRFIHRPDVVVTQHIGATTTQARAFQTLDAIRQVQALAQRRMPPGAVNAQAAWRLQHWLDAPAGATVA